MKSVWVQASWETDNDADRTHTSVAALSQAATTMEVPATVQKVAIANGTREILSVVEFALPAGHYDVVFIERLLTPIHTSSVCSRTLSFSACASRIRPGSTCLDAQTRPGNAGSWLLLYRRR
jgi:hypothetical protein